MTTPKCRSFLALSFFLHILLNRLLVKFIKVWVQTTHDPGSRPQGIVVYFNLKNLSMHSVFSTTSYQSNNVLRKQYTLIP